MDVHSYIRQNEALLVKQLQDMVRVATVNPPGRDYEPMVSLLERRCRGLGMKVRVHRVPDHLVEAAGVDPAYPRCNLIARLDVGAAKTVHFNAHYDVVPAAGDWRCGSPFEPGVRGGFVYGRGSGDMKGSIAALLMAIESFEQSGVKPAVNVECSFTADEETGGELGAGFVVRQGLVNADFVIVCEGAAATKVGLGHNGVLWFEVEVAGKAAHASSPELGVNAFEHMAALVVNLDRLKSALSAGGRGWKDFGGKSRNPTVNIGGVFSGGDSAKVNTVPETARFSIDRRVVPAEAVDEARDEVLKGVAQAARSVAGIRYQIKNTLSIAPCVVPADGLLPQAFGAAVRAVRRRGVEFRATSGFTDLHFFVVDGKLSGIGYGVQGEGAHALDERVRVRDLVQTSRVYAEFLVRGI